MLRALPSLIQWVNRIQQIEKSESEPKAQQVISGESLQKGHAQVLDWILRLVSQGEKDLEESVRQVRDSMFQQLQTNPISEDLLLLVREHIVHEILVGLLKLQHPMPPKVADYLVGEVIATPAVCAKFHSEIFQNDWEMPCNAPITASTRGATSKQRMVSHP